MNALMTLRVFRYGDMWAFDDPERGLIREPFIAGIDKIIDLMVAKMPKAKRGFNLTFSANPFPGAMLTLINEREESGGVWYYCKELDMVGWLCPALFKFFSTAPKRLYVMMSTS